MVDDVGLVGVLPRARVERRKIQDRAAGGGQVVRMIGGVQHHADAIVLEQVVPLGRQGLGSERPLGLAWADLPGAQLGLSARRVSRVDQRRAGRRRNALAIVAADAAVAVAARGPHRERAGREEEEKTQARAPHGARILSGNGSRLGSSYRSG